MIKSLRQARITDGLPRVLARQEWVIALSEALGLALGKTLDYTDESQIYTRLDTAPEAVLDVLAVDWKIDWYDTELTVEQKRRIVKTALTVRRLMGTAAAVKLQVHAIYPEAAVTEWFQYDGRPGCFRVSLPLPKEGITVESCIIGEWKKNVGDAVNVGDILFTYETDKAEFECESTAAGTLLAKFYEDGDEVPCLANVCAIGKEGDAYEFLKKKADVPAQPVGERNILLLVCCKLRPLPQPPKLPLPQPSSRPSPRAPWPRLLPTTSTRRLPPAPAPTAASSSAISTS